MNETLFYHAVAVAAHGNYHSIKNCRGNAGSWEAAYHALKEAGIPAPDPRKEYERLWRLDIRLAMTSYPEYPDALRHISHPPFGIYLRGAALAAAVRKKSAKGSMLAVVGTRRASTEGKTVARRFARELAASGFTIASGLAFGIDAAAHEGALDAGGATVAVLAGGLDDIYPRSHHTLAQRIIKNGGTLISEYPPGETPVEYRFIERNRIISGISRGTLIVEAPASSGALATARYAVEQNREVFVVPGPTTTTGFNGSHALIRQGAELVTSPDDILDAYEKEKRPRAAAGADVASPAETLILKALAEIRTHADVDKLVAMTRLEPRMVNQTLSFLLIRGIIKESGEGYTI